MNYEDFKIGERFWMGGDEWQCMDLATQHILAVKIMPHIRADPSWLNGPPFAVALSALDAQSWINCYRTEIEMWDHSGKVAADWTMSADSDDTEPS